MSFRTDLRGLNQRNKNQALLCIILLGAGGLWVAGSRYVSVESVGSARVVHVFLASSVCSANLHILHYTGPAHI